VIYSRHNPTMQPKRFASVAFAVFKDKPGPKYAERFAEELKAAMQQRDIAGGVFLRNHPENDEQFLGRAGKDVEGVVMVRPVGGLQDRQSRMFYNIHYAIGTIAQVEGGFKISWEASVTLESGNILRRYDELANVLLDRMIQDGVI